MKYIEFKVHASRQGIEQVTALFLTKGIDQVSIRDPEDISDIMEEKQEYEWDYVNDELKEELEREPEISAYFEDTPENRELVQQLKIAVMMLKSRELEGIYGWDVDFGRLYAEDILIDDEAWKDKWKENFKPVRITEHLVVKPTWEDYEASDGDKVIEIDPGMAFGTGTHETTSLCLRLMEKYIGNAEAGKVLDVGCGSGILSIAAAVMGCEQVLAVDIDEDAVRTAEENIRINGVADTVQAVQGDLIKGIDFKADMIVANLMAELVVMLSESAMAHMKKGGIFISSGILTEKRDMAVEAIKKAGFKIEEVVEDGEWCAVAARA